MNDPGFEGIGDFSSDDPWDRYIAHQAAKGNYPARPIKEIYKVQCACSKCSIMVSSDEYTFPHCSQCYVNIDGKCD